MANTRSWRRVGSSGDSVETRLHFSITHFGAVVEPQMDPTNYWHRPRAYANDNSITVLDGGVTNYSAASDLGERPSETTTFTTTKTWPAWVWFRLSHLKSGDVVQTKWYRPNGTILRTNTHTATGAEIAPFKSYSLNSTDWSSSVGLWRVAVEVGGVEKFSRNFTVTSSTVSEIRVTEGSTQVLDDRTTPIDFGSIAVGGAAPQRVFTIENHGGFSLLNSTLVLPPGFSVVGSLPTNIAAGSSATLTIQLDTSRAGVKQGELRFTTNDADESTFNFQIKGTVTGAAPAGAPSIVLPGPAVGYLSGEAPKLIDAAATFSDSDSSSLTGGTLTVAFDTGADANDRLGIRNQGTTTGLIGANGATITFGGVRIATYSGGVGSAPLVVTFLNTATPAAAQALLRNLVYSNANVLSTATRFLRFTVVDDTGKTSNQPLKRVVTSTSLASSLDMLGRYEGSGKVRVTLTRNQTDLSQSLTVMLSSSDTTEATVPATVTFAANSATTTFDVTTVDDTIFDGTQNVVITMSANGYVTTTETVKVYDDAVTRPLWVGTGATMDEGDAIEYSQGGIALESFAIPIGAGGDKAIRDLVVDPNGDVQIYSGTLTPYLNSFDPVVKSFSQTTLAGWSSANVSSFGGIAAFGDYVFATDNETLAPGAAKGIVRFNTTDGSSTRIASDKGFQDLNLGLDGLLYAMEDVFPTKLVRVYNPATLALVRSISFESSTIDHRGLAVAANGDIFTAAWDGTIYRFDSNWNLLDLFPTGFNNLSDIDLAADGTLLATSRFGDVLLLDSSLTSIASQFNTGVTIGNTFAGFARTVSAGSAILLVELSPSSALESAGANLVKGKVTRLNSDLTQALTVNLASNDTTEATTGASVTIGAGKAVAYFDIAVVDDQVVDGPKHVTITASAAGTTSGSATLTVLDDDTFSVELSPAVISENGGTATGTVTRNDLDMSVPLVVSLVSGDTSEATTPASVTILANQASATFTVTAVDDALLDGSVAVTITASAAGHPNAAAVLTVLDHETLAVSTVATTMSENGGTITGTVTRSNTNTASNLTVNLATSDSTEATTPIRAPRWW